MAERRRGHRPPIFGKPLKLRIIDLWTAHPDLMLSVRQLARHLGCSEHTARQTVYELRRDGHLILSTTKMYHLSERKKKDLGL